MNRENLRVVYLTAGAGGMYCGSCLSDNTLARALTGLGVDIQLVPTYTPITTDEQDVSLNQVYFGGINVYLQQKFPWLRWLPAPLDRLLNHPKLIRWATRKDVQADPAMLGAMTVSMLKASAGNQTKEVRRLLDFLHHAQPDVINFTNVLIAGSTPEIRKRVPQVKAIVTLQGDDIFLDYIPEPYRAQSVEYIRQLDEHIDGYLVHSNYYADYMSERLAIPREKLTVIKLGIDYEDFQPATPNGDATNKRIGYLARLTPEKGLHHLVDAFIQLRSWRDDVELAIAGWVGSEHQAFAEEQFAKLRAAGVGDEGCYAGTVDREGKIAFLKSLDIFTVPTTYQEPKGRFALEAMACGLPVVLPDHGAFPELVHESNCGVLVRPEDSAHLAETLHGLLNDREHRQRLGAAGRAAIINDRNAQSMARQTLAYYRNLLSPQSSPIIDTVTE